MIKHIKKYLLTKTLLLLCIYISIGFTSAKTYTLTLTVTNIKNIKGKIIIGIFNKKESFLEEGKEYKTASIQVSNSTEKYSFRGLPKGKYAIALFHDENADNKCNRNILGIPKEGIGFSNNCKPGLSPPSFEDCAIDIKDHTKTTITLIHY